MFASTFFILILFVFYVASKTAIRYFLNEKTATNRERDLIRAMKDEDTYRNFPGTVKVVLPRGKTNFKK